MEIKEIPPIPEPLEPPKPKSTRAKRKTARHITLILKPPPTPEEKLRDATTGDLIMAVARRLHHGTELKVKNGKCRITHRDHHVNLDDPLKIEQAVNDGAGWMEEKRRRLRKVAVNEVATSEVSTNEVAKNEIVVNDLASLFWTKNISPQDLQSLCERSKIYPGGQE
jgi:hypothetical protein